ncbi:MAG: LysE family transporter, partial [Alphaproteobacteria bacterium]|nr:LysE family transporter [Alphaproteobacteria bacterium]
KVTAMGVKAKIKDSKGKVTETEFSHCITAIGIVPNTENVGLEKLVFAVGASLASLSFFAAIGFGAKRLSPFIRTPRAWQIVDLLTALVMFIFAGILLAQTSWTGAG